MVTSSGSTRRNRLRRPDGRPGACGPEPFGPDVCGPEGLTGNACWLTVLIHSIAARGTPQDGFLAG